MWSKQGAFLQRPSRTWGSRSQSLKGAPQGAGNSTAGYLCSERSGWGLGGDGGRDGGGMKEGHCAAVGWRTAPPCGTAPSWLQGQGLHPSPPPAPASPLQAPAAPSPGVSTSRASVSLTAAPPGSASGCSTALEQHPQDTPSLQLGARPSGAADSWREWSGDRLTR